MGVGIRCPELFSTRQSGALAMLRPYQIVSLWDMLELHAEMFLTVIRSMTIIEQSAGENKDLEVDDGARAILLFNLARIADYAELLDFKVAKVFAADFAGRLRDPQRMDAGEVHQRTEKIRSALDAHFSGVVFMCFPANRVRYHTDKALFGDEIERKLPSVSSDIAEAGRCFAFDRYTACVFHLMRVLEAAIKAYATHVGVTFNPNQPWGNILQQFEKWIANSPIGTPVGDSSSVVASLHAVKEAWRNPTMHEIQRTFTEVEAKEVWECSGTFIRRLANLLP